MTSTFLAEFLGLYILVSSGVFLFRYEEFVDYVDEFVENTSMRFNVAFIELGVGLGIILNHNIWQVGYKGVITAIGWMAVVEAIFHLSASEEQERRMVDALHKDHYWKGFAVISIVVGVYLLTQGFATL